MGDALVDDLHGENPGGVFLTVGEDGDDHLGGAVGFGCGGKLVADVVDGASDGIQQRGVSTGHVGFQCERERGLDVLPVVDGEVFVVEEDQGERGGDRLAVVVQSGLLGFEELVEAGNGRVGHKRLIPRDALQAFALIESRVQATVESSSFPFLGGISRFVPNPRLGDLTDKLEKLRDEFREATLDFVAGYSPLRENAMAEWREAARHMNGSAERLIATIDGSENGVHQRTLNRLTTFIDNFRSLSFAGDQQLEATLERFRRDLLNRHPSSFIQQHQAGKVGAEVATVEGGEAVCLNAGVGGDEKVRDEVQAWSAVAPVAQEDLAGEVSGRRGDGIVEDVQQIQVCQSRFHMGIGDGKLRKGDGRDDQFALACRSLEAIAPCLPAGLFPGEEEENVTIEGGENSKIREEWPTRARER